MQITKTADNPYQKLWHSNFALKEPEPELATICERIIELYERNLPEDEVWSILSVSDDYGYDDPSEGYGRPFESFRSGNAAMFSCAVPTNQILRFLSSMSPLIEIGAGSGYWASLLSSQGAKIRAIDNYETPFEKKYFDIEVGDHALLETTAGNETLLLVWPPDKSPMAASCLKTFRGDRLVYIGEPRGGKMADDEFFDILQTSYECHFETEMPLRWPNKWQDNLCVFHRRT